MKRCLLATLVLLGACSLARAEYLIIVLNLAEKQQPTQGTMTGGALGITGGMTGITGGMTGIRGGTTLPASGGMTGSATGIGSGVGARGGMGYMGGMGARGGMGYMGGMASPNAPPADADEQDDLVVVVLEVGSLNNSSKVFQVSRNARKLFENERTAPLVPFQHRFGGGTEAGRIKLATKTQRGYEATFLKNKGVPVASASTLFQHQYNNVFKDKDKTPAEAAVKLAFWALEHGLTDECVKVMDRIAETDKSHTAVKAYLAVKADLARPLSKEDVAGKWKEKLLPSYTVTQTDKHHFALIHPSDLEEVTPQLDRLEQSVKNYYYWWALRGIALPVAKERLVAALTAKRDVFDKLEKQLTASAPLTDSFSARREGLVVFNRTRTDHTYEKLLNATRQIWQSNYDRKTILSGKRGKGVPRGVDHEQTHGVRTFALILKVLEDEWEHTAMTHEASRRLLFSSGLLPSRVNAPEWLQFGMGGLFEAPLQSPWPTIGAPNPYWLPRFKEFNNPKKRKYEATPYQTLVKVVTDGYFREKVKISAIAGEKPEDRAARQKRAENQQLRKARAASWSLVYFLARRPVVEGDKVYLSNLQRYFKELARQPRDMQLDEKTLLACFRKAFEGEDLQPLANRWISFINGQTLENAAVHEKIREVYARVNKPAATTGTTTNPGATAPPPPR